MAYQIQETDGRVWNRVGADPEIVRQYTFTQDEPTSQEAATEWNRLLALAVKQEGGATYSVERDVRGDACLTLFVDGVPVAVKEDDVDDGSTLVQVGAYRNRLSFRRFDRFGFKTLDTVKNEVLPRGYSDEGVDYSLIDFSAFDGE